MYQSRTLALTALATALMGTGCFEDWGNGHDPRRWVCEPDDGTSDPADPPVVDPMCPTPSCPGGTEVSYISGDTLACAAIDFTCPEGELRFDAPCGCGCRPIDSLPPDAGPCPDEGADGALYLSREGKVCDGIDFTCPDGQERFDGPCGCGCWDVCPAADDPLVHYLSDDVDLCGKIDFTCPDDCEPFDNRCGCGCIEPGAGAGCPNPDDPNVLYVSTSTTVCSRIMLNCPDAAFNDECGCGCVTSDDASGS